MFFYIGNPEYFGKFKKRGMNYKVIIISVGMKDSVVKSIYVCISLLNIDFLEKPGERGRCATWHETIMLQLSRYIGRF